MIAKLAMTLSAALLLGVSTLPANAQNFAGHLSVSPYRCIIGPVGGVAGFTNVQGRLALSLFTPTTANGTTFVGGRIGAIGTFKSFTITLQGADHDNGPYIFLTGKNNGVQTTVYAYATDGTDVSTNKGFTTYQYALSDFHNMDGVVQLNGEFGSPVTGTFNVQRIDLVTYPSPDAVYSSFTTVIKFNGHPVALNVHNLAGIDCEPNVPTSKCFAVTCE